MTHIKISCIVLLAWLFATGCGKLFNTTNPETVSIVKVRILEGFEEHWVFIEGHNSSYLKTFVGDPATYSRPQNIRFVEMNSSQSTVVIRRVPANGNRDSQSCYISLQLEAGQDYILNLTAENNQIQTSLQEESQEYL